MSSPTPTSTPPSSSLFCNIGSEKTTITDDEIKKSLHSFLDSVGERDDVLLLPPDFTRFHSQAGKITRFICEYYNFIPREGDADADTTDADTTDANAAEPKSKKTKVEAATSENKTSQYQPDITILPALGTHLPMTESQIKTMFGNQLSSKQQNASIDCSDSPSNNDNANNGEKTTKKGPFLVHDWRNDVVTIGHAPAQMVSDATNGRVNEPWPAQLNKLVWEKRKEAEAEATTEKGTDGDGEGKTKKKKKTLILSIGQVVPHEVMGMANFNKNLFVGVGGVEAINLSHFIGAVHGMEKMMGRASNPLRSILNYASEHFLQKELDLFYILTVMGTNQCTGDVEMRGFYIGNDIKCYNLACELSLKVNFTMLNRAPKKIVVHLDKDEFHSTWLGNKGIYRTRMAIADGGELIILAPGVKQFGEDGEIDKLIRKHGYIGTPAILEAMENHPELQKNLSAVAHLIHGSSEGRFSITYCPGNLTKEEVEGVGFQYDDLAIMETRYDTKTLKDGWNTICMYDADGTNKKEEVYFISNPALGLWAVPSRFEDSMSQTENLGTKSNETIRTSKDQTPSNNSGDVGGWKKPPSS